MKSINYINVNQDEGDRQAWVTLVETIACGFGHHQTKDILKGMGYDLPYKEWEAVKALIEIQIERDVG